MKTKWLNTAAAGAMIVAAASLSAPDFRFSASAYAQALKNDDNVELPKALSAEEKAAKKAEKKAKKAAKKAKKEAEQAVEEQQSQTAEQAPVEQAPVEQAAPVEPAPAPAPETEQAAQPEPAPEPAPETQQAAQPEPAPETAPETQQAAQPEPAPEPAPEPQQAAQPEPAPEPAPQTEQAAQPEPASETQQAAQPDAAPAQAPEVSEQAERPKKRERVAVEEQIEAAEQEQTAVVSGELSEEQRKKLERAEKKRREKARDNRAELLGAAAIGAVVGALVPALGGKVVADQGDRIIVERDGRYYVRKDENVLFRERDVDIVTERLRNGNTREVITRRNGVQIVTVRDPGGYIIRRVKVMPNGERYVLFDEREDRRYLSDVDLPRYRIDIPRERYIVSARQADRQLFRETFDADPVYIPEERYTLRQVRENVELRETVRRVDLDTINFATGSAYVTEDQVRYLGDVAGAMLDVIDRDPSAVFLIEGHTDAVGSELYNLDLSDRRAESVARILTEFYDVPPENLTMQGYGEQFLKVPTQGPSWENRRVTLRNISPLLETAQAQ